MSERSTFGGKAGFILVAAGSAVGLGTIWRFPTLAAQHGGGTFLVLYTLIVLLFGVVLLLTEVALGRMTRKSPIDAYAALHPHAKWIGLLAVIIPALIMPYYSVVGGWILMYLFTYAAGGTANEPGFFGNFVGSWTAVLMFVIFFVATMAVIWLGVTKGLERITKFFMPVFLIMIIILTIDVLAQPGMMDGLKYYFSFNLSDVNSETVTAALGQVFFSLSLAMGIMITFGSYMRSEDDIQKCAVSVGFIDIVVPIICGMLIVPLAFSMYGKDSMQAGATLVFDALPKIFEHMAGGSIIAVVFFALLFFAAWTSAMSVAEAVIATMIDKMGISRHRAVILLFIPTLVAGIIISLGYGPLSFIRWGDLTILDMLDMVTNSFLMPIVAFVTAVLIGHIVGCKVIIDEVEKSGEFRLKSLYPIIIKWIAPICIALIFVSNLIS